MQIVEPIRDKQKIKQIKELLKTSNYRDYIMFIVGINTGLRISDILKLRVLDVKNRTHINIREQKTNKNKRILINDNIYKELQEFIKDKQDNNYIFTSHRYPTKAISRIQAYRILNDVARQVGITDQIGTHTLRKTFGYWHYQQFKDAIVLQDIFNHSSLSITLHYIGITNDIKDHTVATLDI